MTVDAYHASETDANATTIARAKYPATCHVGNVNLSDDEVSNFALF